MAENKNFDVIIIGRNGSKMDFDTAYAAIPFAQHSNIPIALGGKPTEQGHIKTDMSQKTTARVFLLSETIQACSDP